MLVSLYLFSVEQKYAELLQDLQILNHKTELWNPTKLNSPITETHLASQKRHFWFTWNQSFMGGLRKFSCNLACHSLSFPQFLFNNHPTTWLSLNTHLCLAGLKGLAPVLRLQDPLQILKDSTQGSPEHIKTCIHKFCSRSQTDEFRLTFKNVFL